MRQQHLQGDPEGRCQDQEDPDGFIHDVTKRFRTIRTPPAKLPTTSPSDKSAITPNALSPSNRGSSSGTKTMVFGRPPPRLSRSDAGDTVPPPIKLSVLSYLSSPSGCRTD